MMMSITSRVTSRILQVFSDDSSGLHHTLPIARETLASLFVKMGTFVYNREKRESGFVLRENEEK